MADFVFRRYIQLATQDYRDAKVLYNVRMKKEDFKTERYNIVAQLCQQVCEKSIKAFYFKIGNPDFTGHNIAHCLPFLKSYDDSLSKFYPLLNRLGGDYSSFKYIVFKNGVLFDEFVDYEEAGQLLEATKEFFTKLVSLTNTAKTTKTSTYATGKNGRSFKGLEEV